MSNCGNRTSLLQEKDQTIAKLEQERDEYKLAFEKLIEQRFRNRSERYLDNPDQLRLDFGNTPEAADAAEGLADAVEDLKQTIPEHQRAGAVASVTKACRLIFPAMK